MKEWILFAALGLGPGALYAGIAVAIILFFRGGNVVNVAAGAYAMVGAFLFYGLKTDGSVFWLDLGAPFGTWTAMIVTIVCCAIVGALAEALAFRPLRSAAPLAKLVASVGILLIFQALVVMKFGDETLSSPAVLPTDLVRFLGVEVPVDRFVLFGVVVAVASALAIGYRRSRFGLETRAAAENEGMAMTIGLAPARLAMLNAVIAATLAGALGACVSSLTALDSAALPLAVVPALGAALLGGFTSFAVATAAGLGFGVLQSTLTLAATKDWFPAPGGIAAPGVYELVTFAIIAIVMLLKSDALPRRGGISEIRLPRVPRGQHWKISGPVLVALAIIGLMVFPYDYRQAEITTIIGAVVCMSFVLSTGYLGQVSLMQVVLGGVAGFVMSRLAMSHGVFFPFGAVVAVLAATLCGSVVGVVGLRVRGVSLAIVTLAAAVAVQKFYFDNVVWGSGPTGASVPEPSLLGIDIGPHASPSWVPGGVPSPIFGFFCLALVIVVAAMVAVLPRTNIGRMMLAVRSNEPIAATSGVSVRNVKLTGVVLSSAIAGAGGVLYAYNFGSVTSERFGILACFAFVAYAYLGGIASLAGALIGGLFVPESLLAHPLNELVGLTGTTQLFVAGIALVLTIVLNPGGVGQANSDMYQSYRHRRALRRARLAEQ